MRTGVLDIDPILRAEEHFPTLLKALTDLAHEGDRFLREYAAYREGISEQDWEEVEDSVFLPSPDTPSPDTLEFLIGRAMQAIRKANTRETRT